MWPATSRAACAPRSGWLNAGTHYTPPMARELPDLRTGVRPPAATTRRRICRSRSVAARPACRPPTAPSPLRRHPDWIRARMPSGDNFHELKGLLRGLDLNTVCEEARCPNIGECWDQRTATIMILGDTCTRACGFCAVKTGRPTWFDDDEPRRVAEAVAAMRLEHVVVTSVARDDLPDGGSRIFAETILPDARPFARAWASRSSSPTSTAPTSACGRSWTPGRTSSTTTSRP